jgi:hypothetical protein
VYGFRFPEDGGEMGGFVQFNNKRRMIFGGQIPNEEAVEIR